MLKDTPLLNTDALGIGVDWLEAAAFAWLAKQTLEGKTSNLPAVTGAKGLRILGAIYPA
jgi:anhydro-N-acetylmuramic acid kinase